MIWRAAILFLLSFFLSACGFHLRGEGASVPSGFQEVYVDYAQPNDLFVRKLKAGLSEAGVSLVSEPSAAKYIFHVSSISQNSVLQASSTTGQVNAYRMEYSVGFSVTDAKGDPLLAEQLVKSSENYVVSSTQLLISFTQQPDLTNYLQRDVIQKILTRLSSQNARKALA